MKTRTVLLLLLTGTMSSAGCGSRNISIEVPDGFVGYLNIRYLDESCEARAGSVMHTVIRVDSNGSGCSRSWDPGRWHRRSYYYIDGGGNRLRRLEQTHSGEGGLVWEAHSEASPDDSGAGLARVFIGTEEELRKCKRHQDIVPVDVLHELHCSPQTDETRAGPAGSEASTTRARRSDA